MKKKTYPLYYEGKNRNLQGRWCPGDSSFSPVSSGRTIETGDVSSSDVTEQTKVALDKIKLAWRKPGAAWSTS